MDLSKSFIRRDRNLQLIRQESKPLTMMHRMSCSKADDIDSLEEVIDLERDLERYQKDTLRKIKPQQVYHMGLFEGRGGLYRISREVELSVVTHPVELRIVSKNIETELKYCGYKYIHQGMYIIGVKGMTRKKLGAKVLITLLDKRWGSVDKASLGFMEGDMNENRLITYIAPDLMMPVKEFIDKMSLGFQTKGYEEFKGTNLLVSIEFIGRLTNKSSSKYRVNVDDVIESMQSKGIKFMSPLKISSEERAGEEWKISELIEKKELKQPNNYISYQNCEGTSSIRFTNYKPETIDDTESFASESEFNENKNSGVTEYMEKADLNNEIIHYEGKLKHIEWEYNNSMTKDWPKIREKELFFIREIARLKRLRNEKKPVIGSSIRLNKNIMIKENKVGSSKANNTDQSHKNKDVGEEEQWDINNKLLTESYEEEEESIKDMLKEDEVFDGSEDNSDFINSLDDVGIHNLENAMEAMEVEMNNKRRRTYGDTSVKREGERERPRRAAGTWSPEKDDFQPTYIPEQYRYMGTKRRDFEKPVQFQNYKNEGAILNLAAHDPIDWPNIISIWKGLIVQKYIQNQHSIGNKVEDMITYLETFLGESVKVLWEQWVETFPSQYEELKAAGSNPHNFANIISLIVIAEDPDLGDTTLQNERLREIEKLTLTSWKGIKEFSQHYLYNATTAKQGFNKGVVERYFNKLPDPLGSIIFEEYKKQTDGSVSNISQAINFVFKQLRKVCMDIQAQRSMKKADYNFCNNIVQIPLTYGENRHKNKKYYKPQRRDNRNFRTKKRYFLRRSDNRAPYLHKRNVRRYDPRKTYDKTCRCFICNSPDHLSKTCPNKDQKRYSSKYEEQERVLIIDSVNENILVCDEEIKDDESIYSIIETDEVENDTLEEESSEDEIDLIDDLAGLKIEMMNQVDCEHDWIRGKGDYNIKCVFCIYYPSQENRSTCSLCLRQACASCLKARNQAWRQEIVCEPEERILFSRVRNLENRMNKLEADLEEVKYNLENNSSSNQYQEDNMVKNTELKDQMVTVKERKGDRLIQLKDAITSFGNKYIVRLPFKEVLGIRIPVKIVLKPNISYKILALLDTGCTKNIIHDKYFARCPEIVKTIDNDKAEVSTDMSGIQKIHNQLAYNIESYINGTKYIIDEITIRDLSVIKDDMILGLRFLQQSLQTTIIHEDGVTFIPYQDNVPYISEIIRQRKSVQNAEISNINEKYSADEGSLEICKEEELSNAIEEYHIENTYTECIGLQSFSPNWYRDIKTKKDIDKIVQKLEDIQIIGEIPMKHWDKNSIVCKINIINPDYIIKSGPIEATPKDIEEFKMHIEELLKLKAIRESRSPHRSAAFIVRNHAEEVRGKSRMVINYKRLNDNTIDDAFNIPNKQEWINRIQGSKYFSKFDLKAGFWQVKMAEESIPWTAFTCPQGHYEWLVMPLGLKNAPALFQRKMQNIFNENQAFILVYVDDLLVFSKSYKEHIAHLEVFFRKVEQNGLILSKKKMEICKEKINFLGHEIGEGKIHLQEHIAKKILQFPDSMNDKKVLQQFLGIVNYARNYIDNLAKLAGPLYAKLRKNGQRYFNSEDIKLVKAIKEKVKNLKPLELPLEDYYFIIETDASKVGWGAILKQKPNKYSPKAEEKICRYASGSYKLKTVNNIDREILAVVHAIDAFRLYLGFKEFTVRTDCEAICRYYNQINSKKSSTRRWVLFEDIITGNGYKVVFEHIKGKDNCLPDIFSRSSILQE